MAEKWTDNNCWPTNETITTEAECKKAADKLHLTYENALNTSIIPPGCHIWKKEEDKFKDIRNVFFNTFDYDPSKQSRVFSEDFTEVCKSPGMALSLY